MLIFFFTKYYFFFCYQNLSNIVIFHKEFQVGEKIPMDIKFEIFKYLKSKNDKNHRIFIYVVNI